MVRLLSLLILLVLPNPFASQDSTGPGPEGQTPPAVALPLVLEVVPVIPARAPDALVGKPVPALPDSTPASVDPPEPPTL